MPRSVQRSYVQRAQRSVQRACPKGPVQWACPKGPVPLLHVPWGIMQPGA